MTDGASLLGQCRNLINLEAMLSRAWRESFPGKGDVEHERYRELILIVLSQNLRCPGECTVTRIVGFASGLHTVDKKTIRSRIERLIKHYKLLQIEMHPTDKRTWFIRPTPALLTSIKTCDTLAGLIAQEIDKFAVEQQGAISSNDRLAFGNIRYDIGDFAEVGK